MPACPLPIYASPPTRRQVDAYMFPCPQCGPAAAQVKSLFDYWVANGVNVTRVWLDIEGTSYWLGNADSNRVHPPMLPPPPAAPPTCPHLTPLLPPPHPTAAPTSPHCCRRGMLSSSTPAPPCSSTLAFTVQLACHMHARARSLTSAQLRCRSGAKYSDRRRSLMARPCPCGMLTTM